MAAQNVSWSSYHWAASANALHSLVRLVSEAVTASNSAYLEVVQAAFADAFATPHEWKLSRFSSLKDQLTQTTLPSIVGGALAECKPVIDSMVDNAFIQNYHQTLPANTFALLNQRILGCILQHLQAAITHPGSMVQSAPSANQLKLVEDSRTATERSELDSELEQLQAAATGIKGITTGVTSAATSPTAAEQKDVGAKPGQASTRLEPKPVAFALPGAYVFKWPTVTKAYSESELQDDLSDDSPEPCIQTPASKRRKKEEPKCEKKEKRKHKHSAAT